MPSLRSGMKKCSTVILIAVRRCRPSFEQHLIVMSFWVSSTQFPPLVGARQPSHLTTLVYGKYLFKEAGVRAVVHLKVKNRTKLWSCLFFQSMGALRSDCLNCGAMGRR
jgi:hypothetical protein